jgi:hypothetical protein
MFGEGVPALPLVVEHKHRHHLELQVIQLLVPITILQVSIVVVGIAITIALLYSIVFEWDLIEHIQVILVHFDFD